MLKWLRGMHLILVSVVLLLCTGAYLFSYAKPFIADRVGQDAIKRFCAETEISFLFNQTVTMTLKDGKNSKIDQQSISEYLRARPEIIKLTVDLPEATQFYYNNQNTEGRTVKMVSSKKVELPQGVIRENDHENLLETFYFKPDHKCFEN